MKRGSIWLLFLCVPGIYALNGAVNVYLQLPAETGAAQQLKHHLDGAVFVLLFALIGLLLLGIYGAARSERGYLYAALFSLASSLLLLLEWDEKSLLFRVSSDTTHASLLVKSFLLYIGYALLEHILGAGRWQLNRRLTQLGLGQWLFTLAAYVLINSSGLLAVLNQTFLTLVMVFSIVQLFQLWLLLVGKSATWEQAWAARGMFVFLLLLLPDAGKDLLLEVLGVTVTIPSGLMAQGLEDTYSWGLLVLVVTFSGLFLRRYTLAVRVLEQESEARIQVDQMLTMLSRVYAAEQLEKEIRKEGQRLFPHAQFRLRWSDEQEDAAIHWSEAGGTDQSKLYIGLGSSAGAPYLPSERDRYTLRLMARYIALIYDYFRLMETKLAEMEAERQSGQGWASRLFLQLAEKERRRLASDLHDGVLQEILHLRRMGELTREELSVGLENVEFQLRETCSELMPSFLLEQGLHAAVAKLVEKTRLRADFAVTLEQEPVALSEEQTIAVYRIVQELLTNAMKHSEAAKVSLRLAVEEGQLIIAYKDDGIGLGAAPSADAGLEGLGLKGMQERIRLLGGTFELASAPGEGLRVSCRLQL
jgi:signal transduction histidine kinase